MKKMNNTSGFTLLEILVVIIIVGVLASVAMPQLFKNVERSRATEALNTMGTIGRAIEACGAVTNNNTTACGTYSLIGMTSANRAAVVPDPANPSSHFNYAWAGLGAGGIYTITATRAQAQDEAVVPPVGTVILTKTVAGGTTRTGTAAFLNIQ